MRDTQHGGQAVQRYNLATRGSTERGAVQSAEARAKRFAPGSNKIQACVVHMHGRHAQLNVVLGRVGFKVQGLGFSVQGNPHSIMRIKRTDSPLASGLATRWPDQRQRRHILAQAAV